MTQQHGMYWEALESMDSDVMDERWVVPRQVAGLWLLKSYGAEPDLE